jgi:hypothetical protein
MKVSEVRTVRGYRAIVGILAALLLSLPANAAWKSMAPLPVPTGTAAAEAINGIIYVAGGNNGGPNSMLHAFNQRRTLGPLSPACPLLCIKETELE